MKKFFISGVAALLLFSFSAKGVSGDEHWDSQFSWPGNTNVIFAIATHNGKIYTAGYVSAGTGTNTELAVWDGYQWSSLAVFCGTAAPVIYDMTFLGNNLYVAGSFNSINGAPFSSLAKWDGTSWSSVGLTGSSAALTVSGNNLYVAGSFTNADSSGVQMTNVGYFDGSAWHALGSGVGMANNGFARAIAVNNGLVYAGGYFTNCGSQFITNIAVWNGSSWSAVGGGIPSLIVYALAFNGSDLYAGGQFAQAGSVSATNIARWDGANWNSVGNGLTSTSASVDSLATFNGSVCAAGVFTNANGLKVSNFAVWNGSSWSSANGGVSATCYRVINNGNNVLVGGNFLVANNKLMNGIATWDGSNWNSIGTTGHLNGVYAVPLAFAADGTNLYTAGSSIAYAGQTNLNLVGRFDGTNWYALGSGISGSSAITGPIGTGVRTLALAGNNLYTGGYFTNAGGVSANNIAVWNGSNWSAMGNGPGGAVYSILVRTNGIYAVGAPFYNSSYFNSPFFSKWDGNSWQSVAINFPQYTDWQTYLNVNVGFSTIASIGTNIYIGGYFYLGEYTNFPSGYVGCNNIMRFDGNYGWIMGAGLNSNVTCMAVISTNLFVGGNFTNAGGIAASKIAMWNGSSWTNLGSGVVGSGVINGLAVIGQNLYADGTFTNIGGVSVNRVAKWDGTNWFALGSGLGHPGANAVANSIGTSGNDLYIGGFFRTAGTRDSFNIAHWNDSLNYYTPQIGSLSPSNGQFRVRLYGTGGLTNIIQASTNFTAWVPVFTNTAGICDFTDTNVLNYPFRFYRAILGP